MSIFDYNPKGIALKRMMASVLEAKYNEYDDLLSRTAHYLVTDNDLKKFSEMIADIYEIGYLRAVNDYQEQVKKLGLKINITTRNLGANQK